VVAPSIAGLSDIAADNSHVYIATSASGQITSVPVTGGSGTALAATTGSVAELALNGSTLYWLDGAGISNVPTAGGTTTQVIEFDGGHPTSFAVDATSVYFTDAQLLDIRKTAK
jgi:hypothetical protein